MDGPPNQLIRCLEFTERGGPVPESQGSSMSRSLKVAALTLALGTAAALTFAAPAAVAGQGRIGKITIKHTRLDWAPTRTGPEIASIKKASARAGVPLFT